MKRFGEAGHALPLVALSLATLMGFGGLAVDAGYWKYQQRQQQAATDAAAIGGAQQLLFSSCPNLSAADTAAKADAARNGYTNGGNVTVTTQNPPSGGTFAANSCAVKVQIGTSNVPAFFSRLFGQTIMNETTQATATVSADNNGCIYMLSTNQNTNFNGSTVNAPGCSIYLNGSANFNGAKITAGSIGEVNYGGSNNGGTFYQGTPAQILPISDPCREIPGCAALTNSPPSTSPCNGIYSSGIMQSGCYSNLNANGKSITLATNGFFVLTGGANFNGATITGTNVTIYIASGASTNFTGAAVNITAPTGGTYANVALFQAPGNSNDINLNGSSSNIGGLLYAPAAHINYNGGLNAYTVIVAAYANFNGSNSQNFGSPPMGSTIVHNVVLAQ